MDVSSVGASALTPEVQAQYAAKLLKIVQESEMMPLSVLEDVVEISQEAMDKCLSELSQNFE